ncbi:MAG: NAD(P)/FAD-dependent oxidoreductase [Kordiimonas sp.]
MLETDFLIVGAGVAGASIAYRLAPFARVTIIDMEEQAGYHTTGRSAAFFAETYGGPLVQPITSASKAFFQNPPLGFADVPLMSALGAIHVFYEAQRTEAQEYFEELVQALPNVRMMSANEVIAQLPYLNSHGLGGGILDPDCSSLDVAALHQGFLRSAKKDGATLLTSTDFVSASFENGLWHVETSQGKIVAHTLVNTAGAWADEVAIRAGVAPLSLEPLRRTVVTIGNPKGVAFDKNSPIFMRVGEEYYFKPEGDGYLLTPGDEVLMPACDVQPEHEDVALAVYQFEKTTNAQVERVDAKWAGLRTFALDRGPVIGFAPGVERFFWSVGQGGFGIQTAPAWSELAAALLLGKDVPQSLIEEGIEAEAYTPARFLV